VSGITRRGNLQQFTLVTQAALGGIPWLLTMTFGVPLLVLGTPPLAWHLVWPAILVQSALSAAATVYLVSMRRPPPLLLAVVAAVSAAELTAVAVVTAAGGRLEPYDAVLVNGLIMTPLSALWAGARRPVQAICATVFCAGAALADPHAWATGLLVSAGVWTAMLLGVHSSVWSLDLMRRIDGARQTASRLAVAEERLRIARDLHDVIGRNLAVVALKSELAARFAQDVPEAKAELEDIRQVVRRSQEEVREVVNGYRDTSLASELEGAASVLEAAGITCRIQQDVDDGLLDAEVRSGLGWSIREGVTNVIRHSRATVCTIRLLEDDGQVQLTVGNDRALDDCDGTGTGLVGLGQRLDRIGGTLRYGLGPKGTYRLQVTVPHRSGGTP
jgi:two-component system sensor histidine kinase DesK